MCLSLNYFFIISIILTFINDVQSEERFAYFPFDSSSGWSETTSNSNLIDWARNDNECSNRFSNDNCLYIAGEEYVSRVIPSIGYHTIRITLEVDPNSLESGEYCYIKYRTSDTSWTLENLANSGSTSTKTVNIPDTNTYNNQSLFQIRIGNSGVSGSNDNCWFDTLQIYGVAYTLQPTVTPSSTPSVHPSNLPSTNPTISPSIHPTLSPSRGPTSIPSRNPTILPSIHPTVSPSKDPTLSPSRDPTLSPSRDPTLSPSVHPTLSPSGDPTLSPSKSPTFPFPSKTPTLFPSDHPSNSPTKRPTLELSVTVFRTTNDETSAQVSDVTNNYRNTTQINTPQKHINIPQISLVIIIAAASAFLFTCICILYCVSKRKYASKKSTIHTVAMVSRSNINEVNHEEDHEEDHEENQAVKNEDLIHLKYWLNNIVKLGQYYENFVSNGYETLEFVTDITDKQELIEIGIVSPGHLTRIMTQIRILKRDNDESKSSVHLQFERGDVEFVADIKQFPMGGRDIHHQKSNIASMTSEGDNDLMPNDEDIHCNVAQTKNDHVVDTPDDDGILIDLDDDEIII